MRLTQLAVLLGLLLVTSAAYAQSTCSVDTDCVGLNTCMEGVCQEKLLVNNWGWQIGVATIVLCFTAVISSAAGVGGGGVYVPLFIIVLGMSPLQAIPISQAAIFGGSIINMLFNTKARHPNDKDRPLIDYDTLLVLTPMLLAGTVVGVILSTIFPSWLLVAMLVVTLGYASKRTTARAWKAWKTESEYKRLASRSDAPAVRVVDGADAAAAQAAEMQRLTQPSYLNSDAWNRLMQSEISPKKQIGMLVVLWASVLLFAFLRGGRTAQSVLPGVAFCSASYWTITCALFVVLIGFTLILAQLLYRHNTAKTNMGWKAGKGEIDWNRKNTLNYPFLSFIAGLMGGLLGIGGGMILGPLLLELGMDTRRSSATSAAAVFITSSSAAIQYLVLQLMFLDYAGWFLVFGLAFTFVGQTALAKLIKKFNRPSIIIICVASVIALATIMMTASGIATIIQDAKMSRLGFKNFC